MATKANRMLATMISSFLKKELSDNDGSGSFLWNASETLTDKEFTALEKAVETRIKHLTIEAAGCPDDVFEWDTFFGKEWRAKHGPEIDEIYGLID